MRRNPEFSIHDRDFRDRFAEDLITIVMILLAVKGWLEYAGR